MTYVSGVEVSALTASLECLYGTGEDIRGVEKVTKVGFDADGRGREDALVEGGDGLSYRK